MAFFGKTRREIQAVVDLGAGSIRGAVFAVEDRNVQVIKKMSSSVTPSLKENPGYRLHELLFNMVRELERIPGKITIAIGPHIGKYLVAYWSFPAKGAAKVGSLADARKYFQNLFAEHREPEKALIAYPLEIIANGYGMSREFQYSELRKAQTLGFRTIMLYLPDSVGADLLYTKESFGGMPIEFVPRVAVYREAIAGGLGKRDAFLIEIENEAATIALITSGELRESRTFSFSGADDLGKKVIEELEWFYTVGPIPPEVLLFGEGGDLTAIADQLKSGGWLRDYSFADIPQLRILEAQSIFKGDTLKGELRGPSEVGLGALIYYSLNHKPLL